jgi:nucleolin
VTDVAADKVLYDEKMENYVPAPGTGSSTKKAKTDPLKPKKPVSAYVLYTADARVDIKNNNPEIAAKDVLSVIGKKWTDFKESTSKSDKKKMEKYKAIVIEQKEEYDEKMKTYQPSAGYDEKGRLIKSEEELAAIADAKKVKGKKSSSKGKKSSTKKSSTKKSSTKKSSAKESDDESSESDDSSDEDAPAVPIKKHAAKKDSASDDESSDSSDEDAPVKKPVAKKASSEADESSDE